MLLILTLSFTLTNMAALARSYSWHLSGDILPQLTIWLIAITACAILYRLDRTALRGICCLFLITSSAHTLWSTTGNTPDNSASTNQLQSQQGPSEWQLAFEGARMKQTPHVFLMTYDSYVENETLLKYGIDNSAQEEFLREAGFQLYPGTYSVAASSRATMSRVLGADSPLRGVAGFSPMLDVLKTQGYQTAGIFKMRVPQQITPEPM